MSVDTGHIEVTLHKRLGADEWLELLLYLKKFDLSCGIGEDQPSEFLKSGQDNDDFEWSASTMSEGDIHDLVQEKIEASERIGFALMFNDDPSHCLHLWNNEDGLANTTLVFALPDQAKRIDQTQLTDFNVYLPSIAKACFQISKEFSLQACLYVDRI